MKTNAATTDLQQRAALRVARRRATGLLAVVAVAFVASQWLEDSVGVGYLRAALEAGLVGGLADWFAVVALFRHPLGIPIPKTAVIPRSKDGLGANLSTFIEENFLDTEQVRARLADPAHVEALGAWLQTPTNADRVAARAAEVVGATLAAADEDAVVSRLAVAIHDRLPIASVAQLSGAAIEEAVRAHRHQTLVTSALESLRLQMESNRPNLRRRLGEQSPTWVPSVLDDLVFSQAEHVVRRFLTEVAADTDHELRRALDEQLAALGDRLQHDDALTAVVTEQVRSVLTQERLEEWVRVWWHEVRLRVEQAGTAQDDGDSELRSMLSEALVGVGHRLAAGGGLHDRVVETLSEIAPVIADVGQREVGSLVSATIDRWDAEETANRLELWMGRDLQFVRINGTIVGAIVGLVLHAVDIAI